MTTSPDIRQEEEQALVCKVVQTGDSSAFAQLLEPYEKSLYAVLYSVLGGNEEDVLDARQEVLIAVFTSLKNFRGQSSFHTWLYRLAP
jgi:RNA polymerase sigma-70 factor (ECF subfamily)